MSGAAEKRSAGGRPAGGKAPRRPGGKARVGAKPAGLPWWRRPLAILAILTGLFLGFPLAQALFGDIGALMLGCIVAGFALGRATA